MRNQRIRSNGYGKNIEKPATTLARQAEGRYRLHIAVDDGRAAATVTPHSSHQVIPPVVSPGVAETGAPGAGIIRYAGSKEQSWNNQQAAQ
jgi:hypothetical protein